MSPRTEERYVAADGGMLRPGRAVTNPLPFFMSTNGVSRRTDNRPAARLMT
jgi:hypothetical protein